MSAFTELGFTILFFAYFKEILSVYSIFSFGLGIGFAEVILILYLLMEEMPALTEGIKKTGKYILWPQLLDRLLAIGLHVFSRAIIGLSILYKMNFIWIIISVATFAFVDGYAGYLIKKAD